MWTRPWFTHPKSVLPRARRRTSRRRRGAGGEPARGACAEDVGDAGDRAHGVRCGLGVVVTCPRLAAAAKKSTSAGQGKTRVIRLGCRGKRCPSLHTSFVLNRLACFHRPPAAAWLRAAAAEPQRPAGRVVFDDIRVATVDTGGWLAGRGNCVCARSTRNHNSSLAHPTHHTPHQHLLHPFYPHPAAHDLVQCATATT